MQAKIVLALCSLSFFTLAVGAVGLYSVNRITDVSSVITNHESPLVRSIEEALAALASGQFALEGAIDIDDPEKLSELDGLRRDFEAAVAKFSMFIGAVTWGSETAAFAKSGAGKNLAAWLEAGLQGVLVVEPSTGLQAQLAGETDIYFQGFVNNAMRALEARREFILLRQSGDTAEAELKRLESRENIAKARRFAELAIDHLVEIVTLSSAATAANAAELKRAEDLARTIIILILIIGITASIAVSLAFAREVVIAPVSVLVAAAREFGKGNFAARADIGTNDELQLLAQTFNRMAGNLASYTEQLKAEVAKRTEELQREVALNRSQLERVKRLNSMLDQSGKLLIRRDLDLSRANERLQSLDRAKSEFVSVAAHQLRTPLSAVKWGVRLLLDEDVGKLSYEQKTLLFKAYESNERMIELVNDLLDVDHIESGKFVYTFTRVPLKDLLDNVVIELLPAAAKKGVGLRFEGREKPIPTVEADVEKIRAALQNLLENSVKYTMEGGTVTVSIFDKGDNLEITIADTGIGIPKDEQVNVFKKFFRASNATKVETDGSGLGLFIVKEIIDKHGGRITFESEEGKGTTFHLSLPKKRAHV